MRFVLLVVAAAVAVGAGIALPADAVKANAVSLSAAQLNDELVAIDHSPSYQCFLQASAYLRTSGGSAPGLPGVSDRTWSNGAAVEWAYQRSLQLSKVQYVTAHRPSAFSPQALATARALLEENISSTILRAYETTSQTASFSCPAALATSQSVKPGAVILATLPAWFVDEQVSAEAANVGLESLLANPIPESGPALAAWYRHHAALFDTTCVSIVAVPSPAAASAVVAKIRGGMSIAEAARRYSIDPTSRPKGGLIGCYSPTSPNWANIQTAVGTLPTGRVSIFSGQTAAGTPFYYVAGPSSRSPNAYAAIARAVATEVHQINLQAAQLLAIRVQQSTSVTVNPAIGTWVPTSLGGTMAPPPSPPPSSVTNVAANTPPPFASSSASTPTS